MGQRPVNRQRRAGCRRAWVALYCRAGGGADRLHSAPVPQPEQFNIMDPFHKTPILLDSWVTHAIDWIVLHFRPQPVIRVPIDHILSAFQQLLLGMYGGDIAR